MSKISYKYTIGVDECGYGSWAGPIVIGAVKNPINWTFDGLNDSKKLSQIQRKQLSQKLFELEKNGIIEIALAEKSNKDIDEYGLGVCHKQCFVEVINKLYKENDEVILDGNLNPKHLLKFNLIQPCNIRSEIKADNKFPNVMAASIIAKHFRDTIMSTTFHDLYPNYGWNNNMGYIVSEHKENVKKYGLTEFHRKSYNIKKL